MLFLFVFQPVSWVYRRSRPLLILLDLYSTLIPCAFTNAWAPFASSCSDARRDSTSSSRRRRGRLSSRRGSEEAQSHCSGCGSIPARRCTRFHFYPQTGHIRFMLRAICIEHRGDHACYPSILRISESRLLTSQLNLAVYRREEVSYK